MKATRLFFIGLLFSVSASAFARLPLYEKCELEAEKTKLVYSNIFSVIIDLDFAYSSDLNKAMTWLNSDYLKVISWDKRTDQQIRAFVTYPTDLPSKKSKEVLLNLAAIDGVSTLCVSTSLKF